jgi:hypothetical protein
MYIMYWFGFAQDPFLFRQSNQWWWQAFVEHV